MKTIQNDAEMFGFKPNISAYIGVLTRDDANQLVLKDLLNHILHLKGLNSTENVHTDANLSAMVNKNKVFDLDRKSSSMV